MSAAPDQEPARLGTPAAVLTGLGILVLFAVPSPLLDLIGFGYSSPSGPAPAKIHPGTDLLVLAAVVHGCRHGNPLRWALGAMRRFPAIAFYVGVMLVLIVYTIKVQQRPFTAVIDTFLMPAVLFLLLVDTPPKADAVLEVGLHLFLGFNAALGIVEMLTGWRLIPIVVSGYEFTADVEWRASGMLGHPLASAAVAGQYAVMLALGCGKRLSGPLRSAAVVLQLVSLGAFGGRTALVLTVLVFAVLGVLWGGSILLGRRISRRALGTTLLALPVFALAIAALLASGFFDQLADRFVNDNGSAESRSIIFNLFGYLTWQDIILGPNPDRLGTILHLEGIEVGIESFWIGFIMDVGLVMSCLVFAALGVFLLQILARTDRAAIVPVLFFLVIISSSVSLTVKSTSLGQLVAMLMVLMPPNPAPILVAGRLRPALS